MNLPSLEDYRGSHVSLVEPTPPEVEADVEWVEAGGDDIWFDRASEPRDPNGYVAERQDDRDRYFARGEVQAAEDVQVELDGMWSPQLFEPEMEAG